MSTSLSEQLKRLAVPQTTQLLRDKKRPSLLFDPKEAAGLNRETVYQIGLDGLEELITKNQVFDQFKHSLFDISSKLYERGVETADSNKKLDKVIRKFLLLLSPYFSLNCAHKALEWLVNRFLIHEYNREDLLMTIIPYHESNIFVRVVQLMKFKEYADKWFFLKAIKEKGVHLTKQNLLNHAASDVYFIKFVGKLITLLIKHHEKPTLLTIAFNFYCTVFTGAIEYSKQIDETLITQMLPALIKGLNSDIADYCAASYIILGRLVTKIALTDVVLNKFIEKICEAKVEGLKTEATLILLVIYQSQTHLHSVSEQACQSLVEKKWLPKVLRDLSNGKCHVEPFLQALVRGCLHGAVQLDQEEHRLFMKDLMANIKLDDSFIEMFLSILLDATKSKKQYPEHIQSWLIEIIETLERQYPKQFDKEVYKILASTQQGKVIKRRKCLQKILQETMTVRCKFDVLDKLYHPNAAFRKEAMRYLTNNFDSLRDREKEMIKSSFVDRLNDDDVGVVGETLNLIKTVKVLQSDALKDVLLQLAYKCQQDLAVWAPISTEVVGMLCATSNADDWDTFVAVLPFLLPNSDEQLKLAQEITKTSFVQKNPLLNKIDADQDDYDQFSNNVFACLGSSNRELVLKFLDSLKKKKPEERSVLNKYFVTLTLSCILPEKSPIEINVLVIKTFVEYINTCEIKYEKANAFVQKHIRIARSGRFHIEGFLLCVKNVILKTDKLNIDLGSVDLHEDTDFNQYFTILADVLFKNSPNHQKYIRFFINYFCKNLRTKIEFVYNLALCNKCSNSEFEVECLNVVLNLLAQKQGKDLTNLLEDGQILLPYILAMFTNKSEEVRRKNFEVIEILEKCVQSEVFKHLFETLQRQREEIVVDSDQIPLVMFNHLSLAAVKNQKILANTKILRDNLIKASCKDDFPIYLKAKLLELLSHINTIELFEETAADCLVLFNAERNSLDEIQSTVVSRNLARFQADIASEIRLGSNVYKLIETCLKNEGYRLTNGGMQTFAAVVLLKQFDKDFFTALNEEVETKIFDLIVELATVAKNPDVLPAIRHIIKVIDLDSQLILAHFTAMRDVQSPKLDPTKLKRRISVVPTVDILDTIQWKKGLTALEFIQDKKKIRNVDLLLPLLFDILKKCLDFDEQAAVEYPKQLILSSILYLGGKTDIKKLPETMFNMELIVQCIRASQNPQTHYCALLVLAFSAELFPNQVLHNIMVIFTFMGSSLLRHEDAYSFQIISRIIDTVVPILVKDSSVETIANVLRVFVDAMLDVPEHRRMPIYGQLLTKIGDDSLHLFLLLIFESHVSHSVSKASLKEERLEIAASICREFAPKVVLENCIQLIKYLKELPDEIDNENMTTGFDIRHKSPKQFRHFKYSLLLFIVKLLSSKEFVVQVATLHSQDFLELEQLYKQIIINILTYIQRISNVVDQKASSPQAKYWKVILHHSYDVLDSVNALLTPQMFLLVMKGLMLHNFCTIRRRSMELLNSKLQNDASFFDECETEEIYSLVPPLISIIKSVEDFDLENEEEITVQTALLSLKLLVKILVSEYAEKMTEILDFITDLINGGKAQNNVLACVILCLSELCANLRAHAISSLPNFMPALLKIFKRQNKQDSSSLLLLSAVTTIQKVLDTLPLFLSPYLEKLLYELSILASKWSNDDTNDDERLQPVVNKLKNVRQQIGSAIPARVLMPIMSQSYNRLISKNAFGAVGFLMDVLAENLNSLTGPEINANLPEVTNFFLNALQFRTDQKASLEQANQVESQIIKALTKLILKLSESTFKPLYYKLFDWAVRCEEKTEKIITFYALSSQVAESLKSLFVLFAGHFLNNAAQILDACNVVKNDVLYFDDEGKSVLLLENVLKTLRAVFVYDNHKFINKDRFQVLMQPLVDQLENTVAGVECLEKRNEELVTPTIVQFAVATADDSLWKHLNYQILLKMKHTSPSIRLISLHCLKEVVRKLGVDYLPLLPETIPVLAEMLEDEEENVEKACRKAVQEMEKILGEPILKYFKM